MSESNFTNEAHMNEADDRLRMERSLGEFSLSAGFLTPEVYEDEYVPSFESTFGQKITDSSFNGLSHSLAESIAEEPIHAYELRNLSTANFMNLLHERGVISDALYRSGILETRFSPDEIVTDKEGVGHRISGLKHIFLGDVLGGMHDIDTIIDAGIVNEATDTRVIKTDKVKQNGTYRGHVRLGIPIDSDHDSIVEQVDLHEQKKTQFPEGWTADDVILAAVYAADEGIVIKQIDNGFTEKFLEINGVQMLVHLTQEGQIATAFAVTSAKQPVGVS